MIFWLQYNKSMFKFSWSFDCSTINQCLHFHGLLTVVQLINVWIFMAFWLQYNQLHTADVLTSPFGSPAESGLKTSFHWPGGWTGWFWTSPWTGLPCPWEWWLLCPSLQALSAPSAATDLPTSRASCIHITSADVFPWPKILQLIPFSHRKGNVLLIKNGNYEEDSSSTFCRLCN